MSAAPPAAPRRTELAWKVLGVAWLTLGLLLVYYVIDDYRRTDHAARDTLQVQSSSLGSELELRLVSIHAAMGNVRDSVPFWAAHVNGPALASRHLIALGHALEGVRELSLLDASGIGVASNRSEVVGRNLAGRDYFQAVRRERNLTRLYVIEPRRDTLGVDELLLVQSVLGADGAFQGAVVTALDPASFKQLLTGVRRTPDTHAGIAHGSGRIFLFEPEAMSQAGTDVKLKGVFFDRHQVSGQPVTVSRGWNPSLQSDRLVAYRTVQPTALHMDFPLLVSVGRDPGAIFSAWQAQAYGLSAFFLALALVSALWLWQAQRRQRLQLRTDDALAASNRRFAAFFEGSMVGMAATSVEKGWLQVNPALCEMLGYSREVLLEKNWANLTHPDDIATDVAQFERLVAGKINDYRLEKRYIRSNGESVHAFVSVRAVHNADQSIDFLAVVIEDVTERKLAELKTRRALQLMQTFIDQWPGLAYIKDHDARLVMANQAFRSLGLPPALLEGKTGQEILSGAMTDMIARGDERVLATGKDELVTDEYAGHYYESRHFVIDDESGQRLLGGLVMDVTPRYRSMQRAEALLAINEKSGELAEDMLLEFGLTVAERLTSSQVAFLYFVNDDQQTIGSMMLSAKARASCHAVQTTHASIDEAGVWADCVRQKKALVFNDYAASRMHKNLPEGHVPLTRLVSVPVVEDGKVHLLLGMGNKKGEYDSFDIDTVQLIGNDLWRIVRRMRVELLLQQRLDELRAIYLKLADTQSQLLQSEKLSAIGQLAAGVAHEINNPIGFVRSNLGTLTDYVTDLLAIDRAYAEVEDQLSLLQPQAFARVHELKRACDHDFIMRDLKQLLSESGEGLERVARIVQDLKDFSRVGETGWLWADLLAGLESTLNIVRNEIKYKAEVVRELAELPQVRCIPSQINQVFMNLLVNAGQAIEAQGRITLRSGREGDFVWVEVQDDGCGIAPDCIARIFEPFYTSKPVGQGTGLGLSLAWAIVQRHQGTLEVKSEPGRGSTFRVRLPIAGPIVTVEGPQAP